MAEHCDVVVIGAGVVGLAVARQLALQGRDVIVLEQAETIGSETSSRNSEVIHAGIYYPKDSWKARLCVEGRELLYDFCRSHGVAHKRCGKLIVAITDDELSALAALEKKAEANGVPGLKQITQVQAQALEPELACSGALLSPETGIVDSHGLMLALLGEAENHGAMIAFNTIVTGGSVTEQGILLEVSGSDDMTLACRLVLNCAGLQAPGVARRMVGFPSEKIPLARFAKGTYFSCSGPNPFTHLIYPMPPPGYLGIHATMDLAGQLRFGPNLEWVEDISYDISPDYLPAAYAAVRGFWPGVDDRDIQPSYAGVRPKLHGPDQSFADFIIQDPLDHGCPGLINLFGIESPGLTSSLAMAVEVARRAGL